MALTHGSIMDGKVRFRESDKLNNYAFQEKRQALDALDVQLIAL